ncbi:MAG: DUF4091 domain-containing protein [Armatimonadota bacterium]
MAITGERIIAWAADSLDKVYADAEPGPSDSLALEAVRNEFTSAQLAVRARRDISALRVSVSPPRHAVTGADGLQLCARFVGYVPVKSNTPDTPQEELDCIAPCLVPDPLLLDETISLSAGKNQPIWLTIFVPPYAEPGDWETSITLDADGERLELPLRLLVHPITLPTEHHLWVTNWMNLGNFARHYGAEMYSPRFWQVVDRYARNVAAHHQNVIEAPQTLVRIFQEKDDSLSFDFTHYDAWIETFDRAGAARLIEGTSVARRGDGKWENPWFDWLEFKVTRRSDGSPVKLEPVFVIERLLKAVYAHVRERGWADRYLLHVVDEPAPHTEADYKRKSALVHQWVPNARYLEAMSCRDMRGYLDIWVPNINHFDEAWPNYLELRGKSDFELWFYTCMYPTGRYPNRFLDFTLLKTRILHWINWRYHLTGYLHWGLNFWTEHPFEDDRIREDLPPGDCWIVYPGPDGPLDSLRWEQMREGLQDFELLWLLGQRDPAAADEICAGLAPHPLTYARDWRALRAARRQLVDRLLDDGSAGANA